MRVKEHPGEYLALVYRTMPRRPQKSGFRGIARRCQMLAWLSESAAAAAGCWDTLSCIRNLTSASNSHLTRRSYTEQRERYTHGRRYGANGAMESAACVRRW